MIDNFIRKACRSAHLGLLAVLAMVSAMGCTSMQSTLFTDDGCQDCKKIKKHLHGVPTTLDVPTHLYIYIVRTKYGRVSDKGEVTFVPELEARSVGVDAVIQKEIFTVDFKRPASGSLSYDVKFDTKSQYITKINNQLNDQTITSVANLVAQILRTVPMLARGPAAGLQPVPTAIDGLTPFQEIIVGEMFALSEPNVQERIQGFLDLYLNECDRRCPPCPFPGPPPPCAGGQCINTH
jgi:hypothetical protein